MAATLALVRAPGRAFPQALSEHPERQTIDVSLAREQHGRYVEALRRAGLEVIELPLLDGLADATFVEDTAIVLGGRAWICSPRAESRRGEAESVVQALRAWRPVEVLEPPVFIDGGDVLEIGGTLYIGLSRRTNREAVETLAEQAPCPVHAVPVQAGLHLKTSVSALGRDLVVIQPQNVESSLFRDYRWIEAGVEENANCLALGDTVLMAAGYPRLAGRIRRHGFRVEELPMSEFEKADGGVTCLSLRVSQPAGK